MELVLEPKSQIKYTTPDFPRNARAVVWMRSGGRYATSTSHGSSQVMGTDDLWSLARACPGCYWWRPPFAVHVPLVDANEVDRDRELHLCGRLPTSTAIVSFECYIAFLSPCTVISTQPRVLSSNALELLALKVYMYWLDCSWNYLS